MHVETEKKFHKAFKVGIYLKGAYALLETLGGLLVLFISQEFVIKILMLLSQDEPEMSGRDKFFDFLINSVSHYSVSAQHFAAFYLLSHGILKVLLIIALLKNKLWAYPLSIVVFSIFVLYGMARYSVTLSTPLLLFTILNFVIIILIWMEYRRLEKTGLAV